MKNIIVCILSDQLIPNFQFVKEFENESDSYLFLSTQNMEEKNASKKLINALQLEEKNCTVLEIDAFDYVKILKEISPNLNSENKYLINLTGGTKMMSFAVLEIFKQFNSKFYYLPGNNTYSCFLSTMGEIQSNYQNFKSQLNLENYFNCYSYKISKGSLCLKSYEYNNEILNIFLNDIPSEILELLEYLRINYRGKTCNISVFNDLNKLLNFFNFIPQKSNELNKKEIAYLTGDWLEEYVYQYVLNHLPDLNQNQIAIGVQINNTVSNELDVVFIFKNKLHIIECKTSVFKTLDHKTSIVNDTVYKADSINNNLGLFAQSYLFTLSDVSNLNMDRAIKNKIIVKDKKDFMNKTLFDNL